MQIFAYKRGSGLTGIACFLIDRGVVGLKDSWHRIGLERSEFQRMIDMGNRKDLPMRRVTLDEARRMIAGAPCAGAMTTECSASKGVG